MGRPTVLTNSAKKRKKADYNVKMSRIIVGAKIGRWNCLKERLQLKTHAEVATILLDR